MNQTLDFCGVDAHHQNGIAERTIRTIIESARTMLLHAIHKWSTEIKFDLWPFAVRHAVTIYNNVPRNDLNWCTPDEIFGGMTNPEDRKQYSLLKELKTFGCPVFVLDRKSTRTKRLNKWNERSRKSIYLGNSRSHASTVALVLDIKTKHISPQYHMIFDEGFTNIYETKNIMPKEWQSLFENETWKSAHDEDVTNKLNDKNEESYTFTQDWNSQIPHTDNNNENEKGQNTL